MVKKETPQFIKDWVTGEIGKEYIEQCRRKSEKERQRIGQDLHDSLSQTLSGISCLSQVLHNKLAAKSLAEAEEAKRIELLIADSVKLTHSVARGLIPVGMCRSVLVKAVWYLGMGTGSRLGMR